MAEWIAPVFDRTQEDVAFALRKIAEWTADRSAVAYDLKGCVNVSDLNRIEGNIAYLSEQLTAYHYHHSVSVKEWDIAGLPKETDVDRIIANLWGLITAFYQQDTAPVLPEGMATCDEVNAIERNIFLIKELLEGMVSSFKMCGSFVSGSTVCLPMRR